MSSIKPRKFLTILLTIALGLYLLPVNLDAYAFSNGPSANLVIGQSDFTTGTGSTSQAGLTRPVDAIFDSSGNLWVADGSNNRILEFKVPFSSGESASLVLGQPDLTTVAPITTQNGLARPTGIAFDSSGNLWVADYSNSRVLEFSTPFSNGENATIVLGQPDFTTATDNIAQNGLAKPMGITFDSSGNLWVADRNGNRVLEFKAPFSSVENATTVIGQPDFTTGTSATAQNGLTSPTGIAFDSSGNLWVADYGNSRVLEFSTPFSNSENATTVIGQPDFTTGTGTMSQTGLNGTGGIAFDSSGNLWVADRVNSRVLEFSTPFSNGESASAVVGQSDFATGTGSTSQAGLTRPTGIAFDSSGNLWVADYGNNRVLEYLTSSTVPEFPISIFGLIVALAIGSVVILGRTKFIPNRF